MTDNSAEGCLEPEMEVRAEEAEDDVKEFLDLSRKRIFKASMSGQSFALGLKPLPFAESWNLQVRDWLENSVVVYTIEESISKQTVMTHPWTHCAHVSLQKGHRFGRTGR
jgi:hypothetical protein